MNRLDLFCKIVDNYGDIGVCWRLAKQLKQEHGLSVTLWIDDLAAAQRIIPLLVLDHPIQTLDQINIAAWHNDTCFDAAAPIVLEAFGCGLPDQYLVLMQPESIWINVEYLSAEPWVEGVHGRSSKLGTLTRHFFFPGFKEHTGGLIREAGTIHNNQEIATSTVSRSKFFHHLELPPPPENTRKISLFSYPNAPIQKLLHILAAVPQPTICYVPETSILPIVADFFGHKSVQAGDVLEINRLCVHVLPFLSQADYDKLLSICDINFVRGEDSWVRAIWAQKPFIWQPYVQSEDTHLVKLNAFMQFYFSEADLATQQAAIALHQQWSQDTLNKTQWMAYIQQIKTLNHYHALRAQQLAKLNDLATNLVIYIEKLKTNQL